MDRRGWIETSFGTVVSLVMSITGPLLLFFMIPLQVLAVRRGEKAFLYAATGVFFGNIVLKLILTPDLISLGSMFIADSAVFLLLLGGLYAVNFQFKNIRTVLRFLLVTVAVGVLSIPVLLYLGSDQAFISLMVNQIESVLVVLKEASPENAIIGNLSSEDMFRLFRDSFLGSFLAVYFFLLALTWRFGSRFRAPKRPLKEFNVPERLVWFLFIPLTVVLLRLLLTSRGFNMELGVVGFAVSNSLYIMGVLYGLHGYGLLQFLMEKKNMNLGFRKMIGWFIPLSLFIFPLNLIVIIVLPGLGVSELWINYRHNDKELVQ